MVTNKSVESLRLSSNNSRINYNVTLLLTNDKGN